MAAGTLAHVPPPPGKRGRKWLRHQAAQLQRSANTLVDLLGASPTEVPIWSTWPRPFTTRAQAARSLCPSTASMSCSSLEPTRALHRKVLGTGVPVVYLELPQTEYASDLLLPGTSTPAQAERSPGCPGLFRA